MPEALVSHVAADCTWAPHDSLGAKNNHWPVNAPESLAPPVLDCLFPHLQVEEYSGSALAIGRPGMSSVGPTYEQQRREEGPTTKPTTSLDT